MLALAISHSSVCIKLAAGWFDELFPKVVSVNDR